MKKVFCIFLSLLLCCSGVVIASAGDEFVIADGRLTGYNGYDDKVVVPEGVTTLGKGCLSGKSMTEVVLPDSLEVIEDYAISWCGNLKTVAIPENVREIGIYVFDGDTALESIRVADGNEYFRSVDGVLYDYDKELILKYPEAKTTAGYELPYTVTTVGAGAFYATDLTTLSLGNNVITIGELAFADCPDLTFATIGKGLNPNNGLKTLGDRAFSGDKKLTEIYLPAALKEIGEFVFDDCPALQAIHVNFGGTNFNSEDGVLYTFDMKTLVKHPEGRSAEGFTLPDSVTKLAAGAFTRCDFTEIDLTGVTVVGPYALNECSQLKTVRFGAGLSQVGQGAFFRDESLQDVYYAGNADTWKDVAVERDNEALTKAALHFTESATEEPEEPSGPKNIEVKTLGAEEAVPDIDTSRYRMEAGLDGGNMSGQWRYAYGQAVAYDEYLTLTTGDKGGAYTVTYTMPDGDEDVYRFTAEPYAAYRLTYTYGYSDSTGYTSRGSVAWESDSGVSGSKDISVGGVIRRGCLSVTLLRQDGPPVHEHDWGEPSYTWSADNATVTAARTCQTDPTHVETETVNTTAAQGADKTTYTAVFTNPAFAEQKKDVPLAVTQQSGDVDGNGKVESADARLALRASVKLEKDIVEGTAAFDAADVTGDGVIKAEDARYILRASVKLEDLTKLKKTA